MGAERQQGKPYQRLLFPELAEGLRHGDPGEGGTGPGASEERQTPTALDPARALTERLMEEVCQPDNLNQAYLFAKSTARMKTIARKCALATAAHAFFLNSEDSGLFRG